jgi:hypothetical protein
MTSRATSRAARRWMRNASHDPAKLYCADTTAQSPRCRYSKALVDHGGTQPDPVPMATRIARRENAPVRSSSATTAAAASRGSGWPSLPANTRIGSVVPRPRAAVSRAPGDSEPHTSWIRAPRGPPVTKARPCSPIVANGS